MREQGIIVASGNPHCIRDLRGIVRKGLRIVNRGRNTGTRILLDHMLKRIAIEDGIGFEELISRLDGYYYEVRTHTAVAAAIAQNRADASIGIRAAASMYNLDFITLGWENYDFLLSGERLGKRPIRLFLEKLKSRESRGAISSLPGYRIPDDIGEVIWRSPT